jgi:hypothetical protein
MSDKESAVPACTVCGGTAEKPRWASVYANKSNWHEHPEGCATVPGCVLCTAPIHHKVERCNDCGREFPENRGTHMCPNKTYPVDIVLTDQVAPQTSNPAIQGAIAQCLGISLADGAKRYGYTSRTPAGDAFESGYLFAEEERKMLTQSVAPPQGTVPAGAREWLERKGFGDLSIHWPTNKPLPQIDYESGEAKPTLPELLTAYASSLSHELREFCRSIMGPASEPGDFASMISYLYNAWHAQKLDYEALSVELERVTAERDAATIDSESWKQVYEADQLELAKLLGIEREWDGVEGETRIWLSTREDEPGHFRLLDAVASTVAHSKEVLSDAQGRIEALHGRYVHAVGCMNRSCPKCNEWAKEIDAVTPPSKAIPAPPEEPK